MIRGSGPPPQGHGDGALMSPSPPLWMWVGVVAPHPPLWCGVVGWARERDREREGGREAKRKREREREREKCQNYFKHLIIILLNSLEHIEFVS